MSWHTVISIYVVTLFIVDFGDVPFDFWFNLYDLPVHLLNDLESDHYLGIVFSDGMIFPLIGIVFCYYSVKYHHPWLLSFVFAVMLGILEVVFVRFGYMVYYHWNHFITPVIVFLLLRLLAHFADRFINYSPPISYRFRLLCFIYVITEWPGAILSGVMRLYCYRIDLFINETANDRFVAMLLATVVGILAAIFAPFLLTKYRIYLFIALGLLSALFAIWMYSKGMLLYNNWNHLFTFIRYIAPYSIIYLYDLSESKQNKQNCERYFV